MLLSMTGFGKAVEEYDGRKITVEVRSLNAKQLDIMTRLSPAALREVELDMRKHLSVALQRGKVDLTVTVDAGAASLHLNVAALVAYRNQLQAFGARMGIPEPDDWYGVLLRLPDVFSSEEESLDEGLRAAILATLDTATRRLNEYRAHEGEKLDAFFRERIAAIRALLHSVEPYEQARIERLRARILDSLATIMVADIDRGRLEQEMIFYIEKLDITEEKQRLTAHLDYFLQTLDAEPGQGKKLGFIAQEMGREINTLGSKSNDAEMQLLVVKMKDELEQIKEQVLNAL